MSLYSKCKCSPKLIGMNNSRIRLKFKGNCIGKNVIISGGDMNLSVHIDNKRKDILVLSERPTHALDYTTFTAEAKYLINFRQSNRNFFSSLHSNGSDSFFYLLIKQKYISSKQNIIEVKKCPLCFKGFHSY